MHTTHTHSTTLNHEPSAGSHVLAKGMSKKVLRGQGHRRRGSSLDRLSVTTTAQLTDLEEAFP